MNENDPKPGVVIDVTPEHEPAPETEKGPAGAGSEAPKREPRHNPGVPGGAILPIVLALLALVVAAVAATYSYRQIADMGKTVAALYGRVGDLGTTLAELRGDIAANAAALGGQRAAMAGLGDQIAAQRLRVDEALAAFGEQEQRLVGENLRLQEREAELRAAVADVHRRVGRSGTQWMIAEAEYLLRIASHRLNLARDTNSARVALELADQRLRDTRDPGWAGVREQIARDIARLAAFDQPDISGLSARLGAVIGQVPQVKVARATIGPERTLPERVAREPGERSWDTLLDDLWSGFKDSVRIRERDQPVQAMLAPEHQFFLYENLRLHLEAARLALARQDPALYQDNLAIAADWLARYFEPQDAVARAVADAIDALRAVDIRPELPDISNSLRALQVRQRLLEDLAPSAGEAP